MERFSYREIVEQLVEQDWGADFADANAAQKIFLKDMDLSGVCLLAIMGRFNGIVNAIVSEQVERTKTSIQRKHNAQFISVIRRREKKHGLCPNIVHKALRKSSKLEMTRDYFHGINPEYIYAEIIPPEKGTEARAEYNKWMKRKAPKPKT